MEIHDATGRVKAFIAREFLVEFDNRITVETDLFEAEIIDSFGFIELVSFIEAEFGVKLTDDDMAAPEIGSVAGIVGMVASRCDAVA